MCHPYFGGLAEYIGGLHEYVRDTIRAPLTGNLEMSGNFTETSESQGICDRIPSVRKKSENFVV